MFRVELARAGFDLVRVANGDVLAGPRPTLRLYSAESAGFRLLEDRFHSVVHAMMVPKGQAGRLAYIREFIESARASALV